jgi:hypothetical protein
MSEQDFKRRRLTNLTVREVTFTGRGANQPARIALFKSAALPAQRSLEDTLSAVRDVERALAGDLAPVVALLVGSGMSEAEATVKSYRSLPARWRAHAEAVALAKSGGDLTTFRREHVKRATLIGRLAEEVSARVTKANDARAIEAALTDVLGRIE